MAGTLVITEELDWLPAGWVYDNVLKGMASALSSSEPDLARRLLDSRTESNGGFLDLRECDPVTLSALIQAADDAYQAFEARGATSFRDPKFYPGFMNQFRLLREKLRAGYAKRAEKTERKENCQENCQEKGTS
jgi:hypothetical protein